MFPTNVQKLVRLRIEGLLMLVELPILTTEFKDGVVAAHADGESDLRGDPAHLSVVKFEPGVIRRLRANETVVVPAVDGATVHQDGVQVVEVLILFCGLRLGLGQ